MNFYKNIFPRHPEQWHTDFVKETPGFGHIGNRYVSLPFIGCICGDGFNFNPATSTHRSDCDYFGLSKEDHDALAIARLYPPKVPEPGQMEFAL